MRYFKEKKLKKAFFNKKEIKVSILDIDLYLSFKYFKEALAADLNTVSEIFFVTTKALLKKQPEEDIVHFYEKMIQKRLLDRFDVVSEDLSSYDIMINDIARAFNELFCKKNPTLAALKIDSINDFLEDKIDSIQDILEGDVEDTPASYRKAVLYETYKKYMELSNLFNEAGVECDVSFNYDYEYDFEVSLASNYNHFISTDQFFEVLSKHAVLLETDEHDIHEKNIFSLFNGLSLGQLTLTENSNFVVLEPKAIQDNKVLCSLKEITSSGSIEQFI